MPESIRQRNVLITGAASGFGRETALLFERNPGYRVFATDKNSQVHNVFPNSRNIITRELDVRNPEQASEVIRYVIGEYGFIDVLVNNAGVLYSGDKRVWVTEDGRWAPEIEEMYDVHVHGPKRLMDQVIPHVPNDQKGVIINVTSSSMHNLTHVRIPYALSKQALVELTEEYARRFQNTNIRVVAVQPGLFKTGIDHEAWMKGSDKIDTVVIQRVYRIWRNIFGGDPKDVAQVIYAIAENQIEIPKNNTVLVGWDSHFSTYMDERFPYWWNHFFQYGFEHGLTQLITQSLLGFAVVKAVLHFAGK